MTKGTSTYVDFNTLGHESSKYDFHYEISIPLAKLGVTAADVASKGLGVMLVATFGTSGMDSLPYDTSMSDNANQLYSRILLLHRRRKMPTISPFLSLILVSPCNVIYIKV